MNFPRPETAPTAPPPPPSVNIAELEPIHAGHVSSSWAYKTKHHPDDVQRDGYWDAAASHGVRPGDRIEVQSWAHDGTAWFGTLAIVIVDRHPSWQPGPAIRVVTLASALVTPTPTPPAPAAETADLQAARRARAA